MFHDDAFFVSIGYLMTNIKNERQIKNVWHSSFHHFSFSETSGGGGSLFHCSNIPSYCLNCDLFDWCDGHDEDFLFMLISWITVITLQDD
jgi:hypothetical protein